MLTPAPEHKRNKKMKLLLLLSILLIGGPAAAATNTFSPRQPAEKVNKELSATEKAVRNAAVKVVTPGGGHGSGSLIKYKDITVVVTARHVTDGAFGTTYLITQGGSKTSATLIYQSNSADIAVLVLDQPFHDRSVKPMKWNPTKDYSVGKDIFYSGYPSHHKLMSFNGRISGYESSEHGTQLIVNTYGWFGCSGSVIYDENKKIIGILYGVDVEYYPGIQVQENMIWIAPIKHIDIKEALAPLCRGTIKSYKACQ
jgi:hypothetical protein